MKLLSFSGGATKIAALVAHGRGILVNENYQPDIIAGVSSGAISILPMLLGKHKLLEEKTTSLQFEDFFDKVPVNKKGKITLPGYYRGISKGSFGSMNNLFKTLKTYVSEVEFNLLMRASKTPLIYVGVTNMTRGKLELIKINDLPYEKALRYIVASASIPLYCPPIKINDSYFFDGGVMAHNIASELLEKFKTQLTKCISVYSRPQNPAILDWGYDGKYLGRNLSKTVEVMQNAISKENEKAEVTLSKLYAISLEQKFSPSIMKGVYDIENERLKQLYNEVYGMYKK